MALVADLTEIFSQVTMARKDGGYHPFLCGWRLNISRLAEVYEAMSLMFDDRASLYLAQYVVRQHAEDNKNDHLLAIAVILSQVYVDDIKTSLSSNDEAIHWFSELPEFFRRQLSRCYRIAEKIVVYTSIHTMVDASLLAYADVTYVGRKYEDAAREEEGKQVRALGKKERCKSC